MRHGTGPAVTLMVAGLVLILLASNVALPSAVVTTPVPASSTEATGTLTFSAPPYICDDKERVEAIKKVLEAAKKRIQAQIDQVKEARKRVARALDRVPGFILSEEQKKMILKAIDDHIKALQEILDEIEKALKLCE